MIEGKSHSTKHYSHPPHFMVGLSARAWQSWQCSVQQYGSDRSQLASHVVAFWFIRTSQKNLSNRIQTDDNKM